MSSRWASKASSVFIATPHLLVLPPELCLLLGQQRHWSLIGASTLTLKSRWNILRLPQMRNKVHNKGNALESSWNHALPTPPWSAEKLFSMKPVPDDRKAGNHCFRRIMHWMVKLLLTRKQVSIQLSTVTCHICGDRIMILHVSTPTPFPYLYYVMWRGASNLDVNPYFLACD